MAQEDNIQHMAAVRVRYRGHGNLNLRVYSMGGVRTKILVPVAMQDVSRIAPTRIVNFTEQRIALELKTTNMDDYMRVNRITVFLKEVGTSYPGS
jgi:hypothetical protein